VHYREIRHLSMLVAFTDLIAVKDSTNKTAESTCVWTVKFSKCFPRNCAKLRKIALQTVSWMSG